MIQGWFKNDYLILFEDWSEVAAMTDRYGIEDFLPGYCVFGIKGWNEFLLVDSRNSEFIMPTVPLDLKLLRPYEGTIVKSQIQADARFTDKIKWYVKPIVFGGDPKAEANIIWVNLDQHIQAVRYWNKLYWDLKIKGNA